MFDKIRATLAAGFVAMAAASHAGTLEPERLADALNAQPDARYLFVTSTEDAAVAQALLEKHASSLEDAVALPVFGGFAATMSVAHAVELTNESGVRTVWYMHPDEAPLTHRVLQALEAVVANGALISNLSLGPPASFFVTSADPAAPVPRALEAVASRGPLSVVAIGNEGSRAPGYVNPWSALPWVMSVGAWDHRDNTVWAHSSTGTPEEPDTWPDVVAHGVDVIGPMTGGRPKTPAEKAYDEGHPRFQEVVAPDKWNQYTMKSGSSMAAAQVSNAAAQVAHFLTGLISEVQPVEGAFMFAIEVGPERINAHDEAAKRLTGTAKPLEGGGVEYAYTLDLPWKMIKQILIDTAIPVPGAPPWTAGAGIVDPQYIRAQFGKYGTVDTQILPLRVTE